MKRPFALVGFSYLLTLLAAIVFGRGIALLMGGIFAVCLIGSLLYKRMRKEKVIPLVLISSLIALCSFGISDLVKVKPVEMLDQKEGRIVGTICDLHEEKDGRFYYIIQTEQILIADAPETVKLRLSTSMPLNAEPFDIVYTDAFFYLPNSDEPFSSRAQYLSKGIQILAYSTEYEPQVEHTDIKPAYYYALFIRQKILSAIRSQLPPEQAEMVNGIVMGEKNKMDGQIINNFRTVGTSHILAVSGFHLSILMYYLMQLLKRFKLGEKAQIFITIVFIFSFMAIIGFSPSIVRAGVMGIVYLLGKIFDREADSINSLGLSVLILCGVNPYSAVDVGMLLSVMATLGLIILSEPLTTFMLKGADKLKIGKRVYKKIVIAIVPTIAANCFILPISVLFFQEISLISPVANVFLTFPVGILLICGIVSSLLYYITPLTFLSKCCALIAGICAKYMTVVANILSKVPFASINTSHSYILLIAIGIIVLFAFAVLWRNKAKIYRTALTLSIILLVTSIFSYQIFVEPRPQLAVMNNSDGTSIILTNNRKALIIGCGGQKYAAKNVAGYVDMYAPNGVPLLILPSNNSEMISGAYELAEKVQPDYYLLQGGNYFFTKRLTEIKDEESIIGYFSENSNFEFGENICGEIFIEDSNVWVYITMDDITFLICLSGGDAELIPEHWQTADIFVFCNIPKNIELIDSQYFVLSASEEKQMQIYKNLPENITQLYQSDETSVVIIRMSGNKQIEICRE